MKRMEIFCASQASTAICMSMDQASCSSSSSTIQLGGKAIDRHNPIIRDSRRFTRTGIPTNPCVSQPLPFDPKPYQYHQLQKTKSKKSSSTKQSDKKAKKGLLKENNGITRKSSFDAREQQSDVIARKSSFDAREQQSDVISRKSSFDARDKVLSLSARKSWVLPPDLITPPGSSRYLLSDAGFFDGTTDYEPVLPLPPVEPKKNQSFNQDETIDSKNSASSRLEKPPKDQVVVLRVSLHCKGCEGKLRKHLSRMEGVTSFNIDFAAKKVTVVGNVTPLSVLASVSKVKNAQFWTSAMGAPSAVAISAPPASTNLIAVKK